MRCGSRVRVGSPRLLFVFPSRKCGGNPVHHLLREVFHAAKRDNGKRPGLASVVNALVHRRRALETEGIPVLTLVREAKHETVLLVTRHVPRIAIQFAKQEVSGPVYIHMVTQGNINFMGMFHRDRLASLGP